MTKKIKSLGGAGLLLLFISCSSPESNRKEALSTGASTDSTTPENLSSPDAAGQSRDSTHRFIRTADIKFQVKDVARATDQIEGIVGRRGGFVTLSNLSSTVDNQTQTQIGPDSTLEITSYTVTNTLNLRVPSAQLDTTLRQIAGLVDYLDYRVIRADEVSRQMIAHQEAGTRLRQHEQKLRQAIDGRSKKLAETTRAEEILLQRQEEAAGHRLEKLALADQVKYSSLTIALYQRPALRREVLPVLSSPPAYEPHLGLKLQESFRDGWHVFEVLLVLLVRLWALVLGGFGLYWIYRKYGSRLRKAESL